MKTSSSTRNARTFAPIASAFTLIELLVVVAVIAILAAILFPVFAQVRAKAQQTVCLSNMRQISTALAMYTSDYDGMIVPTQLPPTGPSLAWPTLVNTYIKNNDVWACPSAEAKLTSEEVGDGTTSLKKSYCGLATPTAAALAGTGGQFADGSQYDYTLANGLIGIRKLSYGRNLIENADSAWDSTPGFWTASAPKSGFVGATTTVSINEAAIEDPAGTIHIFDAWNTDPMGGQSMRAIQDEKRTDHCKPSLTTGCDTPSKVANRHQGGFNAIYGDGHVRWVKWGSTKACDWSIQSDTCP